MLRSFLHKHPSAFLRLLDGPNWTLRISVLLFVLAALFVVSHNAEAASATGDLVGYWSLDEGNGTKAFDESGNGNHGNLVNAPAWMPGQSGHSLYFSGANEHVEIPHTASLDLSRALTVSAWIYNQSPPDPTLRESEYHIIATKGWAADHGGSWTLVWDRKTNALSFCVRRHSNNDGRCANLANVIETGQWHHVRGVFGDGILWLYVDDSVAADPVSLGTSRMQTNTESIHLGGLPHPDGLSSSTWHGFIDDVSIHRAAWDPTTAVSSEALRSQQSFDFSTAAISEITVAQGSTAIIDVNTTLLSGPAKSVSFSVSGLPKNVSAAFTPSNCLPTCTSKLTIKAATNSVAGSYVVKITAKANKLRKTISLKLIIASAASFDFSLSHGGDKSVTAGSSAINEIAAKLTAGQSQAVAFSATGLPAGTSASFSTLSCNPSCSTTLALATSSSTPAGTYPIAVTGSGGKVTKTSTFNLTVGLPKVATPAISPNGGSFTGPVTVTLQTATTGASIFYTTDGSTPTQSSKPYAGAFSLSSSVLIKAKAFKTGYTASSEAAASFSIASTNLFDFSLSNSGNRSVTAGSSATNNIGATLLTGVSQPVTFSASGLPTGATASFSTAICNPSCSSTLTISTSASTAPGNSTISVTATGGGRSKTTTFSLAVNLPTVATPTINPNGGSYTGPVSVTLQSATAGATIYYTTNGSTPTTSSPVYSGAFTISNSATVKASAAKSGYNASGIATATFTIATAPKLTLAWQDNSSAEAMFEVERKTGSTGTYSQIAKVGANVTSHTDTTVTRGVTYCYRVRAVNSSTVSAYSNETCGIVS